MGAKDIVYSDIEILDEKLQSIKSIITVEQYEILRKQLEEIKRLGIDLPDSAYMTGIAEMITKISHLSYGELDNVKELIKGLKRTGILAKLDYISLCVKNGKDVEEVLTAVKEYWESIKGIYDRFESEEITRKLDEIALEVLLKEASTSKELKLTEENRPKNYLIREKL